MEEIKKKAREMLRNEIAKYPQIDALGTIDIIDSIIDLAVSKERERIVKWVKDNEYCSKCCFPKKSCRKWGESASAIDTDDLLALINTK